ncbi:hypothetical protein [Botrimarina hoheduenensis]|uniref:Uncharacterized protein n=1 Tax=Botrimarina hoheduenensis TaxID=2528000 RepID=A0A5C5VQG7_9BACT|nr:hypothetical protein [Botrimarina hoheduenensis]TWT40041.1 hypothetical protein Pla111_34780 [Botrimarina hoheduenensis]
MAISVLIALSAAGALRWLAFDKVVQLAHRACELFPDEPNFQGLHAIAAVLHRENSGVAKHSSTGGIVLENGHTRPIQQWERWASVEAEKHMARIRRIHEAKQKPIINETDAAFAALNA